MTTSAAGGSRPPSGAARCPSFSKKFGRCVREDGHAGYHSDKWGGEWK
jgi:hypothetical protein